MDAVQKKRGTTTLSESSVVLIGLFLAVVGLTFRHSIGIASLLIALGIGLLIAGTVYSVAKGSEWTRLTFVFVSLVAVQLVTFRGVVQWIGGVMIGIVLVAISYSRLSE